MQASYPSAEIKKFSVIEAVRPYLYIWIPRLVALRSPASPALSSPILLAPSTYLSPVFNLFCFLFFFLIQFPGALRTPFIVHNLKKLVVS